MSDLEAGRTTKWLELIVDNQTPDFKIQRRMRLVANALFEGAQLSDESVEPVGTIVMTTVSITALRSDKPEEQMTLRERRIKRIVDALKPEIEDVKDA